MAQMKAKQIKLNAQGDLIIANSNGSGSVLAKGANGAVLQAGASTVSYSFLDALRDSTSGDAIVTASKNALAVSGESLVFTNKAGEVRIEAKNTEGTGDVDIRLVPQGNGTVLIGSEGSSIVQADNGETLTLSGGDAVLTDSNGFNLILSGGAGNGTGVAGLVVAPTGYVVSGSAPAEAFITKGYVTEFVANEISASTTVEFRDEKRNFSQVEANYAYTLTHTPVGAIDVMINGLPLTGTEYALAGNVVTLNDANIGYSVETGDVLTVMYEYNPA